MKKKSVKIYKILILIICICIIFLNVPLCSEVTSYSVKDKFTGEVDNKLVSPVTTILSTILIVARMIGVGIAIIILTYIGAKFMLASPSERASIKQYSINYIVGAVILVGASGILTIVQQFITVALASRKCLE